MLEVTHAIVKFVQDGHVDILLIEQVYKFKFQKPMTKYSFDRNSLYKAYWQDKKNPKGVDLPVQIGALACVEEKAAILRRKRIPFPPVHANTPDKYYSNSEESSAEIIKKKEDCKRKTKPRQEIEM